MKFLSQNIPSQKRVLLRVDYNVPVSDGRITDNTRILETIPTLRLLLENKNKIILISHLGRPNGVDPSLSLRPIRQELSRLLPDIQINLVEDFRKQKDVFEKQSPNEVILLENIRFFPEEKTQDLSFGKNLSEMADIYVNDAFGVSHRSSASLTLLPKLLPAYAGLALQKELSFLKKLTKNPAHPFLAILGGGKISTKLPLLQALAPITDLILTGGGIANTLLKAQGVEIGTSIYDQSLLQEAKTLLQKYPDKFVLPQDVVTENENGEIQTKMVGSLLKTESIKDIGVETEKIFYEKILRAQTIIWNGPVGQFEKEEFSKGTFSVLKAIAESPAISIVGGGDTIAAISKHPSLTKKITFISTGGGALLQYLEKGTLPALDALSEND